MTIVFACLSYLLGSVPFGYLLFRLRNLGDIRDFGSHNIGATNVLRTTGWRLALPVAVLDILKGFLPVFVGLKLFEDERSAFIFGLCAILGHCYPIFLRFKGGKGVATTVGVFSAVATIPLLLALVVFICTIALTRYVSLGSLLGVFSYPFLCYFLHEGTETLILGGVVFLLITFKHRENIQRLIKGTERKFGEKLT